MFRHLPGWAKTALRVVWSQALAGTRFPITLVIVWTMAIFAMVFWLESFIGSTQTIEDIFDLSQCSTNWSAECIDHLLRNVRF